MAARAIRDDDADYSFLIKQCSSAINCCSVDVRFCATRWPQCGPLSGGRREGDHGRTKLESCRCLRTPASAHVGDRHHRRHGRLRTCRRRRDGRGATDVHRRSGGVHRRVIRRWSELPRPRSAPSLPNQCTGDFRRPCSIRPAVCSRTTSGTSKAGLLTCRSYAPAMKGSTTTCVRDWSPQTQRSPALASGGPLRDPAIDAAPWQQPGRTPRCPRPSAGHDRGAAVHPSSCRG